MSDGLGQSRHSPGRHLFLRGRDTILSIPLPAGRGGRASGSCAPPCSGKHWAVHSRPFPPPQNPYLTVVSPPPPQHPDTFTDAIDCLADITSSPHSERYAVTMRAILPRLIDFMPMLDAAVQVGYILLAASPPFKQTPQTPAWTPPSLSRRATWRRRRRSRDYIWATGRRT